MIKKLLSGFAVVAATALAVNAQPCTPSTQYADSSGGVWPDVFPTACKNNPAGYNLVIDLKTITDTCVTSPLPLCLYIKAFRISSIDGLPAGFQVAPAYNGSAGGFDAWVNGGTDPNWTPVQGCVLISATQADVQAATTGDNAITVNVDLFAKNQDAMSPLLAQYTWTSGIQTVVPYGFTLTIDDACTSLNELDANTFGVAQNYPNPLVNNTSIPFNTVKDEAMTLKVYNMVGALVYETNFMSKAGKNIFAMDASKLSSGMYIYTLSNGKESATRKMTIQK